jgi:anti-sigma factor RsiW
MTTPQDFDRLSAYLDKQLSPVEKAGLEARLEREPELKAALDDFRMTVRALRSLPAVKPPRNFTISQAQARAIAPPRRVFPALRLATALAAFAFVAVIAGDFATNLASPAAAPEVPVTVVAQKSAAPTETLAPLAAAQEAITVTREVSADSAGATTSSANATAESGTPPVSAFALPAPTVTAGGGAGGETPLGALPTLAPSATEEGRQRGQRAAETVTATPEPELAAPLVVNGAPTPAPSSPEAQSPTRTALPLFRYMEVGLALLTVLLAIAAWFLRGR